MECLLSKVGGHLIIQMETERIDFQVFLLIKFVLVLKEKNDGDVIFFVYFLFMVISQRML